jgi:hypothetical protein
MMPVPPIPAELWDPIPTAAQAAVLALVQSYEQQLAVLRQRLEDLEQRLGQNSTNSSRPPSSDPPTVKRAPPRPARRPGAAAVANPDTPCTNALCWNRPGRRWRSSRRPVASAASR